MTKASIARGYRTKHGKEKPTLALARIMYDENKESFTNLEDARYTLRAIEGKAGNSNYKVLPQHKVEKARSYAPYNIPASDEDLFEPFVLKGHKKGLIINDVHLPFHSEKSIVAMFDFAVKEKPDFIFINGDLLDFHQLSYFMKDPRKKRFSEELDMMKDFLKELKRVFNCKIYFKFGNHEERYDSFLYQKAHELKGVEEFELENIVKARVPDITIIKDKRLVVMNGLPFIHGHEFGRGFFSPVNAARGLFLQSKHSCVKGDCHTTSEHTEPDIFGKIMTTYSIGALCGLTPKWLPINKWNSGFAMIDLEGTIKYKFRNYRIYKGEVL